MNKYVVLLRGINVGGNNLLPMKELVQLLEGIACSDVVTYIQSGNAVVCSERDAEQLANDIESEIQRVKGFKASVLVLSQHDLERAIEQNAYSTKDGKLLHLYFLTEVPTNVDWQMLAKYNGASELHQLIGQVFYLYAPDGVGRSKLVPKIEAAMGVAATGRNWNTVQKLAQLAGIAPSIAQS